MRYRAIGLLTLSWVFQGAQAHARGAAQVDDDKDWDSSSEPPKESSKPKVSSKAKVSSKEEKEENEEKDQAKDKAAAEDAPRDESGPPEPKAGHVEAPAADFSQTPQRAPVYGKRSDWFIAPYGYARLDSIEDSTQSFEDGIQPNLIQRAGTYRGDHRRTIMTARDSRLGVFVGAPQYQSIKSSAQLELDFYGLVPTDARRHDSVVFGPLRIRQAFMKLETPIVDIIAGQYYDLFGWNGSFYPATVAYLGVPAEVYHRNPQLRIEKKIHLGQLELMLAGAAVRPGQRDSGFPEGQLGLKISYSGWSGVAMPGFGRPSLAPVSIGLSGLYRRFEVPAFRNEPGSEAVKTFGYGVAASLLLPIIPIKTIEDHGNALTVTGEFTLGTGIADMYTFMDGGSRFPLLPNPQNQQPAYQYPTNVDPGLVTFDRNFDLKTINWRAFVGGLQYFLPVDKGRIWVSGIYSRVWSDNIKELTPFPSWGGIFTKMEYIDGNAGFDITPAIVLGVSFQTVKQTFGDVSAPTPVFGAIPPQGTPGTQLGMPGTGGVPASARNNRAQLSMSFFF
ncbi:MAG: hypothetical protein JWM82_4060 [Myxococcales bacterium]|nr:hypothetical protein [Myxococcales bacterium]